MPFCSEIGQRSSYVVDSRVCKCGSSGTAVGRNKAGHSRRPRRVRRDFTRGNVAARLHPSARCIGATVKFSPSTSARHATLSPSIWVQPWDPTALPYHQIIAPSMRAFKCSYQLPTTTRPPRPCECVALRARSHGQLVGSQSATSPVSSKVEVSRDNQHTEVARCRVEAGKTYRSRDTRLACPSSPCPRLR